MCSVGNQGCSKLLQAVLLLFFTGASSLQAEEIYWGKHPAVTPALKQKVIQAALALETNPSYIMTVMSIETSKIIDGKPEPTFDPTIESPHSSAVGLIQFTAATATELKTTTGKLKAMSAVDQMDYVQKYLLKYKGKLSSVEDTYFAVFNPGFIGKGDNEILPDKFYLPNKGLDKNADGKISRGEVAAYVKKRHDVGAIFKG